MAAFPTRIAWIYVGIVHLPAQVALIFEIHFHYFNLFRPIHQQLLLVPRHKLFPNPDGPHLLRFFHLDDHIVKDEVGLAFDRLKRLENVAVLLSV